MMRMRKLEARKVVAAGLVVTALGLVAAAPAGAETFTNPDYTSIPGTGSASPYPTEIPVSGINGPTTSVSLSITGFVHGAPGEVGIVLQAPNGDALLVQGRAGNYVNPMPDAQMTYSLSDAGATDLPQVAWGPGAYKPTAYVSGDVYPATLFVGNLAYGNPGPVNGGTASFAGTFNGNPPNGIWRLYVRDFGNFNGNNSGVLYSWSLDITGAAGVPAPVTDTTPPETQITSGPGRKTKKKRAVFQFSSSEPGSSFECKLDRGAFAACSSPATFKVKTGRHTLDVRAKDAAGNQDPTPASRTWKRKKRR